MTNAHLHTTPHPPGGYQALENEGLLVCPSQVARGAYASEDFKRSDAGPVTPLRSDEG